MIKQIFCLALVGGALASLPCTVQSAEPTNATATNVSAAPVQEAKTNTVTTADGDRAWEELQKAMRAPEPPAEWNKQPPSNEDIQAYNESKKKALLNAITMTGAFRKNYPNHSKAAEAADLDKQLKGIAYQAGLLSPLDEVRAPQKSEAEQIAELNAAQEKIDKVLTEAHRKAMAKQSEGVDAVLKELEKGLIEVATEFPEEGEAQRNIIAVRQTRGLLNRIDALGKPLNIKFAALDGKEVDLAKLKGKVVLVDFWATWCMPCLMEIPHIRDAYAKLHDKGFEVVSISLDQDKEQLMKFVIDKKIPWAQCFNADYNFAETYGVGPIPAMWLVDKKGNLRDFGGRFGLEDKVTKLLAE